MLQGQLRALQVKGDKATVYIATARGMYVSTIKRGYVDCSVYVGCAVNFKSSGWIILNVSLAE